VKLTTSRQAGLGTQTMKVTVSAKAGATANFAMKAKA